MQVLDYQALQHLFVLLQLLLWLFLEETSQRYAMDSNLAYIIITFYVEELPKACIKSMLLLQSIFDSVLSNYLYFMSSLMFSYCSQKDVAQVTCECERHVGTQSGGMDQVVQMFHLCSIFFNVNLSQ